MDNPLLTLGFNIPFSQIKPEHVEPAIDTLIEQSERELEAFIAATPRTFENTVLAFDVIGERLWRAYGVVGHMESVVSTPELRAAYNAIIPKVSAFSTKIGLSAGVYQAFVAFSQSPAAEGLSGTWQRFVKLTLEDYQREGVNLPAEQKSQLEAINQELSQLATQFSQNVTDDTSAFELYLEEHQTTGLPESALMAAKHSAESKGAEGYRFTLHAPSFIPVLSHLDHQPTRELMWRAFNRRGSDNGHNNLELINRILQLRQNKAQLLGFANFADYILQPRMAKNGQTALAFEHDLTQRTQTFFEQDKAELVAFKNQFDPSPLQPWDVGYWSERLRKSLYDFDAEDLRPYLALPNIMNGLFNICQTLFGIRIERTNHLDVWHPEVEVYTVYRGESTIGCFYTDWYPRDNKRGGAWMNSFVTGSRFNGALEPHLGLMCGNLTPPIGNQPALLTHSDVETIFHEFGHLLHHLLSNVESKSLAGTNVAWDFVELPSQIMENWAWEASVLFDMARHHANNQPLPQDLYDRMKRARNFQAALLAMRQLSFGTMDLELHTQAQPDNVLAYSRDLMQRYSVAQLPEDYKFIASFSHIFGGGYAAGYYSYKWAEVLDADAFSKFQAEGITNPQTGAWFVECVLSKGNSQEASQLYRNFMGRDPNPQALLVRSGFANTSISSS